MLSSAALVALVPALVSAATHTVKVGSSGLVFSPDSITAAAGDTVDFLFYPGNHSVAQSTFSSPCVPSSSDAIFSGFFTPTSGADSKMFTISIANTDPLWLYCSQISHCQAGMAMAINAPSGSTISDYQSAAKKVSTSESPAKVQGGVVAAVGSSPASSAAPASSSAAAASSSAAMSSSSAAAASSSAAAATSGSVSPSPTPSATAASSGSAAAAASSSTAGAAATVVPAAIAAAGGLLAWAMV